MNEFKEFMFENKTGFIIGIILWFAIIIGFIKGISKVGFADFEAMQAIAGVVITFGITAMIVVVHYKEYLKKDKK